MHLLTVTFDSAIKIKWIQREGFATRRVMILKWMVLGTFLTMGYKSALLSTLVPIRYESSIDTIEDLAKSGLPLLIPSATTVNKLIANDPRRSMKKIYDRSIVYPYSGGLDKKHELM